MEYVCKVGTPTGEVVERSFTATDESALRAELERQGLYVFGVRRGLRGSRLRLREPRVKTDLLLLFSQELAALLKAGLPLVQNRVTPELFVRAASRAGLAARIVKRGLNEISDLSLPCVLLLKDARACVLTELKGAKRR